MKYIPEQYLAPVQEFLSNVLGNNYSEAVITGGLIRDLTLGNQPKDTDVLIETSMTVDKILAVTRLIKNLHMVEGYGEGHFTDNYKILLKDVKHDIDYLFIHDHLTIDKVRHSFDCSLNKGYALPHLGIIYPPNLEVFTFDMSSGGVDRFKKFSNMFLDYQKKQPNLIKLCKYFSQPYLEKQMLIKNSYIFVKSSSESRLVQTLLLEAGACWPLGGRKILPINNCIIAINDNLEMFYSDVDTTLGNYEELSIDELVEVVRPDASEVNNSYHVCKFSNNHISFEDSEVDLTIDELYELLPVIRSLSHRDFEITTSDDTDDQVFSLTNLTIHFK